MSTEREHTSKWLEAMRYKAASTGTGTIDISIEALNRLQTDYDALTAQREADRGRIAELEGKCDGYRDELKAMHNQRRDIQQRCEALERERDEAHETIAFLGATRELNGDLTLNMKKYHAAHRCEQHREDPWQNIDTEIDCFCCLKQQLQQAQQTATGLREALQVTTKWMQWWIENEGCDCEPEGHKCGLPARRRELEEAQQALAPPQAQRVVGGEDAWVTKMAALEGNSDVSAGSKD